jgi:hypothetical protein
MGSFTPVQPALRPSPAANLFRKFPNCSNHPLQKIPSPAIFGIWVASYLVAAGDCPIMRRRYTTEERRVWNRRYYEKKRKSGWVNCTFHVPKSVGAVLKKLKYALMECHKNEQAVKWKISDENKNEKKLTLYATKREDN